LEIIKHNKSYPVSNDVNSFGHSNDRDTYKFNDFNSSQLTLADDVRKARERLTKESLGYNSDERYSNITENEPDHNSNINQ